MKEEQSSSDSTVSLRNCIDLLSLTSGSQLSFCEFQLQNNPLNSFASVESGGEKDHEIKSLQTFGSTTNGMAVGLP